MAPNIQWSSLLCMIYYCCLTNDGIFVSKPVVLFALLIRQMMKSQREGAKGAEQDKEKQPDREIEQISSGCC